MILAVRSRRAWCSENAHANGYRNGKQHYLLHHHHHSPSLPHAKNVAAVAGTAHHTSLVREVAACPDDPILFHG
jgi:hypothetical protein